MLSMTGAMGMGPHGSIDSFERSSPTISRAPYPASSSTE